jgi:predicted phosphohydrolase
MIKIGKNILQYCSDIHLEYKSHNNWLKFKRIGKYLALCGDIGNPFSISYQQLIHHASDSYEKTYILTGNHEYWQSEKKYTMNDVDYKINEICNKYNNIHFLNDKNIQYLEGYKIVGCTLWTNRKIISNDNNNIFIQNNKNISIGEINKLHYSHKKFIFNNIKTQHPTIVLTHHLPSYQLVAEKYKTDYYKSRQELINNNLDSYINYPIKYWLCGHSHSRRITYINNVYCGINPLR